MHSSRMLAVGCSGGVSAQGGVQPPGPEADPLPSACSDTHSPTLHNLPPPPDRILDTRL